MNLAANAVAIRLITIACPSIISMTMMADVIGDCVAAARKPTMQMATIDGWPIAKFGQCDKSKPNAAPLASDGAKIPPGIPLK